MREERAKTEEENDIMGSRRVNRSAWSTFTRVRAYMYVSELVFL